MVVLTYQGYLASEAFPAFQQRDCQPCLCVHIFSLTKSTRLLTPGGQKTLDQVVQVTLSPSPVPPL